MPTKCATWIHAAALALSLLGVRSAAAGDSGHYSCSGVGSSDTQRVSLILLVEDYRAAGGAGRDYSLSALHQGEVYKGRSVNTVEAYDQNPPGFKGTTTLARGAQVFFTGKFQMQYGRQPSLQLEGELHANPKTKETIKVKVTLPCVDVSP